MSGEFLLNPKQMHGGKRDETARLARLQAQIEALTARVEALEAKRGPGRPKLSETKDAA